jgi:integrase
MRSLRVKNVDSRSMLIHVERGKGGRDRYVPLSALAQRSSVAGCGGCRGDHARRQIVRPIDLNMHVGIVARDFPEHTISGVPKRGGEALQI